eukprot:6269996-Pyramimonas_sp.AAC.1
MPPGAAGGWTEEKGVAGDALCPLASRQACTTRTGALTSGRRGRRVPTSSQARRSTARQIWAFRGR